MRQIIPVVQSRYGLSLPSTQSKQKWAKQFNKSAVSVYSYVKLSLYKVDMHHMA